MRDSGEEMPSLDIGGEGPFRNVAQFECRKVGAQVTVAQFGRAENLNDC